MTRLAGSMVVLLAVCTATLLGKPIPAEKQAEKKGKQADYYPLAVGNQWQQQLEVNGQMIKMVSQIAAIEKINNQSLARLDVMVDGKAVSVTEHLSANDKGVFRHRYNGMEITPPVCLVKYPIKEGESWQSKLKIGAQEAPTQTTVGKWEQVEVPAGKFKAIRVLITTEDNGQPVVTEYWFAAGVGIVMQTAEVGGLRLTMKLEKFVEGKQTPKDSK